MFKEVDDASLKPGVVPRLHDEIGPESLMPSLMAMHIMYLLAAGLIDGLGHFGWPWVVVGQHRGQFVIKRDPAGGGRDLGCGV